MNNEKLRADIKRELSWVQPTAISELLNRCYVALGEQQSVPEGWWQVIHDTLRNYSMTTLVDEEGYGYPLIDAMTADSQTVSGGIEECTYLADAIWNALIAAAPSPVQQSVPEGLRQVHGMILNALDRDAAEGKVSRGEMAQALRDALAAPSTVQGVADSLRAKLIEGLDEITSLSRNLRHGGCDSTDLLGLEEGLTHAIDVASEMLSLLAAPSAPAAQGGE